MKKPELIMLVGVAGSGKSTIGMRIATRYKEDIVLLSSDIIRGEIYGDENCQKNPGRVFDILHQRAVKALSQGISVIYDATNLSCKRRMGFLKSIARLDITKRCVVIITTPEDIEERMKSRDRKVPMEVVHKQLCQFQCPNYYEGWDNIVVEYNSTPEACHASYKKLWTECDIPHDNPHHSLSVMEHMNKAADIAEDFAWKTDGLSLVHERWAARIHDIGKARTKSFTDRNGNPTEIAHYRNHQNYSAYYSLIFDNSDFDISEKDSLDNACLIQWHMEHYLRNGSALEKFYEMIGPKLEKRLRVLEKADKAAH
jgi:predicted kinase